MSQIKYVQPVIESCIECNQCVKAGMESTNIENFQLFECKRYDLKIEDINIIHPDCRLTQHHD